MSKVRRRIAKFEKLSTEVMKNALRLHLDSILLHNNKSYPSAFNLAVLALEEIAKSNWIDHYVYASITNHGLPEPDGDEEQEWVKLLYVHTKKHFAFINIEYHELDSKFYEFVSANKLEYKKQKSIYVGFEREKGKINTKSRISIPKQIKAKDSKELISLNNDVILSHCKRNNLNGFYYGPHEKFELLNHELKDLLISKWKKKSNLYGK